MKDYSLGELFFTKNVTDELIGIDESTDLYKHLLSESIRNNTRNITFTATHFRMTNEDLLKKLYDIVDYIVEADGKGEVGINISYILTLPSEVTEELKVHLNDANYIEAALRECLDGESGKDHKGLTKPFNFPIEAPTYYISDIKGIIKNPYNIAITGKLVFRYWDVESINNFKKEAFLGTFCRKHEDGGGYNGRRDHMLKFQSSSDSWIDSDFQMWKDFPYKKCAIGLYVHYKNPNVFSLKTEVGASSRGSFELTYLPSTEMDIDGAIESATASLFEKQNEPTAKEMLSILSSISKDKRISQFIDLRYSETGSFIFNPEETASWDSNIYFKLDGSWRTTSGALSDVHKLLLGAKRAVRMFSGVEELLKELKEKDIEIIPYVQNEFKAEILANPMEFVGEEYRLKSSYARLTLSGNPKIRDLAKMILGRLEAETASFDDDEDDCDDESEDDSLETDILAIEELKHKDVVVFGNTVYANYKGSFIKRHIPKDAGEFRPVTTAIIEKESMENRSNRRSDDED